MKWAAARLKEKKQALRKATGRAKTKEKAKMQAAGDKNSKMKIALDGPIFTAGHGMAIMMTMMAAATGQIAVTTRGE